MADFFNDTIPGLKINQQEEPGFEVITRVSLEINDMDALIVFMHSFKRMVGLEAW